MQQPATQMMASTNKHRSNRFTNKPSSDFYYLGHSKNCKLNWIENKSNKSNCCSRLSSVSLCVINQINVSGTYFLLIGNWTDGLIYWLWLADMHVTWCGVTTSTYRSRWWPRNRFSSTSLLIQCVVTATRTHNSRRLAMMAQTSSPVKGPWDDSSGTSPTGK